MDTKTPSTSHLRLVPANTKILTGDDGSGGDGLGPAVVNITFKDEPDIVRQIVHHLCQDTQLFVFNGEVYKMADRPEGHEGSPELHIVDKDAGVCRELLSRGIVYERTVQNKDGRGKTTERVKPPVEYAKSVHAGVVRKHPQRLRQLKYLTEHKMLRDGSITESKNQYVKELQVWSALSGVPQPPPFEFDRLDEFRIGIKKVMWSLFRFRDEVDLHSIMALISSMALLDILKGPVMPVWIFNAAQEGCGKTTCIRFVHSITGLQYQRHVYLPNQEELEKRLASSVVYNEKIITFDNTKVEVNSHLIEGYATSWGDVPNYRLLGTNKFVQNQLRFLTVFTLNNGKASRDLMRRSLEIFLEHPNNGNIISNDMARTHAKDIEANVHILKGYVFDLVASVYNEVPEGFVSWEDAFELFWHEKAPDLGTHRMEVAEESTTGVSRQMEALVDACKLGEEWTLSQYAVDVTEINDPRLIKEGDLAEAISDFAEDIRGKNFRSRNYDSNSMRKAIGRKLADAAKNGMMVHGRVLTVSGKYKNATVYRVVTVEEWRKMKELRLV